MTLDRDELRELAGGVFAAWVGVPVVALRATARALALADGPLAAFGTPIDYFASHVEHEDVGDELATLAMTRALRIVAGDPALPALLERLERVEEPAWSALAAALHEVAG